MLVQAAAQKWGVPKAQCRAENNAILNLATDGLEEPLRRAKKVAELSALRASDQLARATRTTSPGATARAFSLWRSAGL